MVILLGVIYATSMLFVEENKNFTIEKEIAYPVDKVFPQFNNLQNFTRWNSFFVDNKNIRVLYFSPYQGKGSALTFFDKKDEDIFGDLLLRYENPLKTLKFQLFEGRHNTPYLIDFKFIPQGDKTKVIWYIHTPKQPFLKRSLNFLSEDFFVETIDKSVKKLHQVLGNKIDKEFQLENLKFDSLMVESQDQQLLLGVNVNTSNQKDALFKSIIMNHNKVKNYVTIDLAKNDDEYGDPVIISKVEGHKDKNMTYFYGIPVSKKEPISDNNFSFRTLNATQKYVIFYRGAYTNRVRSIQQLLNKAKADSLRTGDLQQTFVQEPTADTDVVLKLAIPVFK